MSLYLEHFGLKESPFRITPHTDFFFDGADRGATLEALLYATLHDEGIVKVVGEVGSGKTMLCRVLMERLPPHVETVYLANPSLTRDEILLAVADELKVEVPSGRATGVLHALQNRLIESFASERRTVVLIDEAHAMPEDALEQVRLLSNLETSRHKLLQIVLFGQPELDAVLGKMSMRQLKDRITHSFRTRPLTVSEVATYVSFRMRAAGYRGPEVFSPAALARLARAAGGLSRRINILADKSLLAAFGEGAHAVTLKQLRAAINDSEFAPRWRLGRAFAIAGGVSAAVFVVAGVGYWMAEAERTASGQTGPAPQRATAPPAASTPEPATPAPALGATAPVNPPPVAGKPLPPHLDAAQLTRFAGYSAAGQPLLADRLAASRDKLSRTVDNRYALELYISGNSDPARVERFLRRARDLVPLESVFIVPVADGQNYLIWAVYGDFADAEAATKAARRLPPKYQREFPLVPRSYADIRRGL